MVKLGEVKLKVAGETVALPVYEVSDIGSGVYDFIRVKTESGVGVIPFTDPSNAAYQYLRIQTQSQGLLAAHDDVSLSTLVDSFEDADLSEYTITNGGNMSYGVDSTHSFNSNYALNIEGGNGSFVASAPGDGLNSYPQVDEWFSYKIYLTDLQTHSFRIWVGSNSYDANTGISAGISAGSNNADFSFFMGDRNDGNSDSKSISDPRDEWYEIKIFRGSDNSHEAELVDSQGNKVASLSITSSDWSNDDYICVHANNFGSGGRTGTAWIDYLSTF